MAPFGFTPKARHNRGVALRSTYRLDGWVMGPVDKEGWGLSYVFAQPSVLAAAATDLAGIGSAINQATAAVAAPTTGLAAAAADEVSTALATLFGAYGQQFQAIGGSSMLTLPDDRAPTGLPDPGIEALAHTKIASTISTVVADGYAVVLSTADIANSLLANAIGYPIAASVALVTPAAGANSSCWPADPSQHHRIAESRACA